MNNNSLRSITPLLMAIMRESRLMFSRLAASSTEIPLVTISAPNMSQKKETRAVDKKAAIGLLSNIESSVPIPEIPAMRNIPARSCPASTPKSISPKKFMAIAIGSIKRSDTPEKIMTDKYLDTMSCQK
jgi:hypothetical protein